jgi:hypothetical protein
MPDPFNRAKMTGDTHPPEVEPDLPLEEGSPNAPGISGTPTDRGKALERGAADRPGRATRKAGLLKDQEIEPGGGEGNTAESGGSSGGTEG